MRYPVELVHEFGAKAGILMYVAQQRPEIPQMPMVVSKADEPAEDFLQRVDRSGLARDRIFRSSAVAELKGYEGDFPSHYVFNGRWEDSWCVTIDGEYSLYGDEQSANGAVSALIEKITTSPRIKFPNEDLPSRINVIAAERAPSKYIGTYIQHPNNPGCYIATLSPSGTRDLVTTVTYSKKAGLSHFGYQVNQVFLGKEEQRELIHGFRWHNAIASLPLMDSDWDYQIEFGLSPFRLLQVRPLMPKEYTNFRLNPDRKAGAPIAFGITSKKGIDFELTRGIPEGGSDLPVMSYFDLRDMQRQDTYNPYYMLVNCGGILQHKDVKALRQAKLCVIYPGGAPFDIWEGMKIHVVHNGRNIVVTPKK